MGKTCLYKHFGEAKALFYYVNLQVNDSVWGQNHIKLFIWRNRPPFLLRDEFRLISILSLKVQGVIHPLRNTSWGERVT